MIGNKKFNWRNISQRNVWIRAVNYKVYTLTLLRFWLSYGKIIVGRFQNVQPAAEYITSDSSQREQQQLQGVLALPSEMVLVGPRHVGGPRVQEAEGGEEGHHDVDRSGQPTRGEEKVHVDTYQNRGLVFSLKTSQKWLMLQRGWIKLFWGR